MSGRAHPSSGLQKGLQLLGRGVWDLATVGYDTGLERAISSCLLALYQPHYAKALRTTVLSMRQLHSQLPYTGGHTPGCK